MSQKKEQKTHDSYDLRAVLEEIELDLIRNLRRNIKHHEKEEEKEGFRWEMWQKAKLRNLAKYRKQNKEIVGRRSKEIEDLINKTLQESFDTAESMMQKLFRKIKTFFTRRGMQYPEDISHRGLNKPVLSEEDFFDVNEKKIDALQNTAEPSRETAKQPEEKPQPDGTYVPEGREKDLTGRDNDQKLDDLKRQVGKDMKEVQGAIWRRMDDIYRQTIYKAEMFMAAGAKTLDQAIDLATREFLAGGIDCIEYSNERRVNVASYAEMALRTASQRAAFLAEGKNRDEWGIHTIFVSAHANTCPKCEPWQGKILVDDVFSSGTAAEAAELGVPLLSTAMKAGLLHPNCRHTLATYFPDITVLPKVPDKDKALKTYEAEQKQRVLERKIRKAKRKVAGACDNDNIRKAQTELRDLQRQIREHLDRHPELRREYSREKIWNKPESEPDVNVQAEKIMSNRAESVEKVNSAGIIKSDVLSLEEVVKKAKSFGEDILNGTYSLKPEDSNPVFEYITRRLGYNRLPEVVDSRTFESIAQKSPVGVIYRGISAETKEKAAELVEEFKTGKFFTGKKQAYGHGIYFSPVESVAHKYAKAGGVIKAVLRADAKVVDYMEIMKEYSSTTASTAVLQKNREAEPWEVMLLSVGEYAALKGYDAIAMNGFNGNQHIIVLNRGKVVVEK